jgi:hypothetical protein
VIHPRTRRPSRPPRAQQTAIGRKASQDRSSPPQWP